MRFGAVLMLTGALALSAAAKDDDEFDEYGRDTTSERKKQPGWFHGTKRDTPAEQFVYAERQASKGHNRRARRAFNALVHAWHDDPKAGEAQYRYARLLMDAGKHEEAFEEFDYLVRFFSGVRPHQEILETQMGLAHAVRTDRYGDILFLPGFEDSGRAVALFEKVVSNGPNWERAPEAQYFAAAIQEAQKDYELAVVSYETLLMRYPRSAFVQQAAYRRAHSLYKLALRNRRDEEQCREALSAMLVFVREHPASEDVPDAVRLGAELKERLSSMYYERALYYDRIVKKPKSAIIAYSDYIEKFPTSERRQAVDERIATLELELGQRHED